MSRSRITGLTIAIAGIAFSVLMVVSRWAALTRPWFPQQPSAMDHLMFAATFLSTTGLLALLVVGLLVMLFSRAVPRWWSLAYVPVVLALMVTMLAWEAEVIGAFLARLQRNPDLLRTGWTPDRSAWLALGPRLILGIVASLAIAAPLLVPPQLARRPPDVPAQPLGL